MPPPSLRDFLPLSAARRSGQSHAVRRRGAVRPGSTYRESGGEAKTKIRPKANRPSFIRHVKQGHPTHRSIALTAGRPGARPWRSLSQEILGSTVLTGDHALPDELQLAPAVTTFIQLT